MNCIIGDLADGAISADPQKGQATAGKAAGEEQERILVSEVRLPLQHGLNQKPKCTQMSLETQSAASVITPHCLHWFDTVVLHDFTHSTYLTCPRLRSKAWRVL